MESKSAATERDDFRVSVVSLLWAVLAQLGVQNTMTSCTLARRCSPLPRVAVYALILGVLVGCGGDEGPIAVTEVVDRARAVSPPSRPLRDDRYRLRLSKQPRVEEPLTFKLPTGWTRIAPTELKNPNFAVTAAPKVQAYVTFIQKTSSVLDNVRRWHRQMGKDPDVITQADVDALPKAPFLDGLSCAYVDLEGDFQPRPGTTLADAKLVGFLLPIGKGLMTFKLIGPDNQVSALRSEFFDLAASFAVKMPDGVAPGSSHGGTGPHGGAGPHGSTGPKGPDTAKPPTGTPQATRNGPFTWTVPSTWDAEPINRFLLGAFRPKSDNTARCTVSVAQGSLLMNVNRWRGQMGATLIDQAALDALPTHTVLGADAIVIRVDGDFQGAMRQPKLTDARLLGVIRARDGSSVFVKMIGARKTMDTEEAAFFALCDSLKESK